MRIAVLSETDEVETRVAATPETVKKYKGLGADVVVQAGRRREGRRSRCRIRGRRRRRSLPSAAEALKDADIVLKVRRPAEGELDGRTSPARCVIAIMDPYGQDAALKALADAQVAAFAMELMPRITRAQVMDVLSSQANLAGYRAVIDAAAEYGRAMPMMMTAAGTVPAARDLRHGRRRRRPPGHRHRPPPRRGRDRHRRAPGRQGAGREPRAPSSSPSRTRSSSRPRPPAATPRRCRRSTRPSRPRSSPPTSPSRTSSSPRR